MTDLAPQLQGHPISRLELHAPAGEIWFADCSMVERVELSGAVVLTIGESEFRGTIDPAFSGHFVESSYYRVVGGGGGWGKPVSRKAYANDAGVKTSTVAREVASEVGEQIGTFAPGTERFGAHYARRAGAASNILQDAASGAAWWVGFDGLTHVGKREESTPDDRLYTVVDWNPLEQMATIAIESPTAIQIGSRLKDERFSGVQVVREMVIRCEGASVLIDAWCGESAGASGRLPELLRKFIRRSVDSKLLVKWRYRVGQVHTDGRCDLVALSNNAPFPNLSRVPQIPGVASAYSQPKKGAVVLVEFIEGRADLPRMSPGSDTRDPAFVAQRLTLGTNNPSLGNDVAYKGATCDILLPPLIINGTVVVGGVPSPLTGVAMSITAKTLGVVAIGSTKVGVSL